MELPAGFAEKYSTLMDESEAKDFLASFDQPIHQGFRVNPLKANAVPENVSLSDPTGIPTGYYGHVSGHTPAHTTGVVYNQEPSATYVGAVVDAQPGERILDLCAAPGGKSTQIAAGLQQQGLLMTNEIFAKRAAVLAENMERFGVANAVVLNETPAHLSKQLANFFDKVVVDAPCSGEGMFRKDPDAVQYWTPDYPLECATRQREILTEAVKMVRPGGQLIYSTCTFAPEEDEQMMAWVLKSFPDFELVSLPKLPGLEAARPQWANNNSELSKAGRLFPHHMDGEGHFIAKLMRHSSETNVTHKPARLPKPDANEVKLWQAFEQQHFTQPITAGQSLTVFGAQLYAVPALTPDLGKLKVLRPGLHLGTLKKNRFEPAFALALATHPDQYRPTVALTQAQWAQFVHGDTVTLEEPTENGWTLATINGNGIGFGKVVGQTLKNGYPKGLRFLVKTD
ncbi:RsmF rRNA methyltransferase first C-terminal domain-containing protein [Furfurilactobacillus milii]|uniref:RNA methyltransferase n=1 Tax=Furfurilactobacillus rossiae TaxID=231049 RepID=A0A7C9MP72_9LACO|nr:RsmF rRNA methyltransferase first C-terminal domain-containing protein [Furfurilactobacillus milii]MYV05083.1 RNA methyltransferase [Furfurilactobacillus milii]